MRTTNHMNTNITLFPFNELTRIKVISGGGERFLDMFYNALRKRKRAEYFKRLKRRQERDKKRNNEVVQNA